VRSSVLVSAARSSVQVFTLLPLWLPSGIATRGSLFSFLFFIFFFPLRFCAGSGLFFFVDFCAQRLGFGSSHEGLIFILFSDQLSTKVFLMTFSDVIDDLFLDGFSFKIVEIENALCK
jgi:hypothetical protein